MARIIYRFDKDNRVVGIIEFQGALYVATELGVFRYNGDSFEPLKFILEEKAEENASAKV